MQQDVIDEERDTTTDTSQKAAPSIRFFLYSWNGNLLAAGMCHDASRTTGAPSSCWTRSCSSFGVRSETGRAERRAVDMEKESGGGEHGAGEESERERVGETRDGAKWGADHDSQQQPESLELHRDCEQRVMEAHF
jgi:hypothetical protein